MSVHSQTIPSWGEAQEQGASKSTLAARNKPSACELCDEKCDKPQLINGLFVCHHPLCVRRAERSRED